MYSVIKILILVGNENIFNFICKFLYVLYEWIYFVWNILIIVFKLFILFKFGKNRNGKVVIELNKCKSKIFWLGRRGFCYWNIYNCRMD